MNDAAEAARGKLQTPGKQKQPRTRERQSTTIQPKQGNSDLTLQST